MRRGNTTPDILSRAIAGVAAGFVLSLLAGCVPPGADEPSPDQPTVVLGASDETPPADLVLEADGPSVQTTLSSGAILEVRPSDLYFEAIYRQIAFSIRNAGQNSMAYSVVSQSPWARVSSTGGESTGQRNGVTVIIDRSGLLPGIYRGTVRVTAENTSIDVTLHMTVPPSAGGGPDGGDDINDPVDPLPPSLALEPASLDLGGAAAGEFALRALNTPETTFTIESSVDWLVATPASGSNAGETTMIGVTVDRANLEPGPHDAALTVRTASGLEGQVSVRVQGDSLRSITGVILQGTRPVPGVTVVAEPGGTSAVTNDQGQYALSLPYNWFGTITPRSTPHVFEPPNRALPGVRISQTEQNFSAINAGAAAPDFFVRFADGEGRIYRSGLSHSDNRLNAQVEKIGPELWRLTLNTGSVGISEVWFPWDADHYTLNENLDDDVWFTSQFAGVAKRPQGLAEYGWQGLTYPGYLFSPLQILADSQRARVVAAANWPPRDVLPMMARNRMALWYPVSIAPFGSITLTNLLAEVDGAGAVGMPPWQLAADKYRVWIRDTMVANGAYPDHPEWFKNANGWLHVNLHDMRQFDLYSLERKWALYREHFPWMQFWGQMSNYATEPHLAIPPLLPGEQTDCCLPQREMHPRYIPALIDFMQRVRSDGGVTSLYARPRVFNDIDGDLSDPAVVDGQTNRQWYEAWIQDNVTTYGATVCYLDVIGRRPLATPQDWLSIFGNPAFPESSVCEGMVDFFPTGFLLAGFLNGQSAGGGPNKTLENLGQGYDTLSVPRFGRVVLPERAAFFGQSNGDFELWGPENNHWVERQTFLLGGKFDVAGPWADPYVPEVMNPVLAMILAEWSRVGWWPREPMYRDRWGITNLPDGVDVRHFIDRDGVSLLVIDNWGQLAGRTFQLYGRDIVVPTAPISIIDMEAAMPQSNPR